MNVKWIPRAEREPEKSGTYLTLSGGVDDICTLQYSVKHNAWNADDDDSEIFVSKYNCNRFVTHWAKLKGVTA